MKRHSLAVINSSYKSPVVAHYVFFVFAAVILNPFVTVTFTVPAYPFGIFLVRCDFKTTRDKDLLVLLF